MSNNPTATLKAWLAADTRLEVMEVRAADLETAFMALIENDEQTMTEAA